MATKTIKTEENTVKQGKTNSNIFWLNMKAYQLLSDSSLIFSSGGNENLEETELVKSFISRNKKTYTKYIINEVKEYNEIVKFGKHSGLSIQTIYNTDKQWLTWCIKNYLFKLGEEKLKKEITEILK